MLVAVLDLCCCVGFSLVAVSGAALRCCVWASHCSGFSCCGAWLLGPQAQWLWHVGFAHGLSYSAACGILSDQGLNPCLLHWQADSLSLSHQGSPRILKNFKPLSIQIRFLKDLSLVATVLQVVK